MSDTFATPWSAACQVTLSVGFPKQVWDFPLQGIFPGTEPMSPAWQWILYHWATWEVPYLGMRIQIVALLWGLSVLTCFSPVSLLSTPWTVAHQVPLSLGFSRQEYWSGLPFPSPGNLSHPGIKPMSPTLQADSLPVSYQERQLKWKFASLLSQFFTTH